MTNKIIMEETKRCPYCGEEILVVAKKCKHCGEWLDPKELKKEKKACPICGELIDNDIEVCPYCNEPMLFTDIPQESFVFSQDFGNHLVSDDNLYCKNCKAPLSIDAESCPHCGDRDPFYFKRLKRIGSITLWGGFTIVFVLLYLAKNYMGIEINVAPKWLGFVCFMIVWLILFAIFIVLVRLTLFQSTIKDYENTMRRVFNCIGNPAAIERWKAKTKEILI